MAETLKVTRFLMGIHWDTLHKNETETVHGWLSLALESKFQHSFQFNKADLFLESGIEIRFSILKFD